MIWRKDDEGVQHVCYTSAEMLTRNIGWFVLGVIFMGAISMVTR